MLNKLQKELDPRLTYHSVNHTLDVFYSAKHLAEMENLEEHDIHLLETAAIYHDCGMLVTYAGHEEASIKIAEDILPQFNYSKSDIEVIRNMIITTKLPQSASVHLDMILCDADLDYLGRPDFFMIAHQLRYEWQMMQVHPTTLRQWYQIQVDFLNNHKYFTRSAIDLRQDGKLHNLAQINEILNHEK